MQSGPVQKVTRILCLVVIIYLILVFVPSERLENSDIMKLLLSLLALFLVCDIYYPRVNLAINDPKKQLVKQTNNEQQSIE